MGGNLCTTLGGVDRLIIVAKCFADTQKQLDGAMEQLTTRDSELAAIRSDAEAFRQLTQAAEAKHAAEGQQQAQVCM
jgi:hypothetical protein